MFTFHIRKSFIERKKQTSIETNIMEHLFLVDNKLGICHTTYQGLLGLGIALLDFISYKT